MVRFSFKFQQEREGLRIRLPLLRVRYYWSEVLTGWLSVDPMADKYPSISPYAYCAWTPVKLVDPDGNEPWYRLISGYDRNNAPKAPTATRIHPVTGVVRPHHGMDMAFAKGARINSAASGKVLFSGVKNGYGNTVVVDHGGGYYTLYAHMNTISVKTGDEVENGAQLGEVGNTGIGTGPHLHVEYIKTDNTVDIFGGSTKYILVKVKCNCESVVWGITR